MQNKIKKISNKEIIKAIKNSAGNMTEIAKRLGIHRVTVVKYIETIPEVKQAYQDEVDSLKEKAVTNIADAINRKEGDFDTALDTSKWYVLKRRKDGEFADKQEVEHSGDVAFTYKWEVEKE